MRIRSNPKRNIRLSQLKDCQNGFISLSDIRAVKSCEDVNFAINLKALVYTVKSQDVFIPVFGTGDGKLDFDVDLSSYIVDEFIEIEDLPSDDFDWYQFKVDVLDNTLLIDDSGFEDVFFDDYFEDWLLSSGLEKKNLVKEIDDFLLRDCDSMNVAEIVVEKKETIMSINKLKKSTSIDDEEDLDFHGEFYGYNHVEKKKLVELFEIKLDFINTYLLSSDNWQSLPRDVFLEIKQYMISKEKYEILVKPSKFFSQKI